MYYIKARNDYAKVDNLEAGKMMFTAFERRYPNEEIILAKLIKISAPKIIRKEVEYD